MTMPQPSPAEGSQPSARDQIRDIKTQAVGQARNTVQQARERAASSFSESQERLAEQIGGIANAVRHTSEQLRRDEQNQLAGLTDTLARQVDQAATYLRGADVQAMRRDLENLTRRQPSVMIASAFALGLLGARFLKSSERRGQDAGGGPRLEPAGVGTGTPGSRMELATTPVSPGVGGFNAGS